MSTVFIQRFEKACLEASQRLFYLHPEATLLETKDATKSWKIKLQVGDSFFDLSISFDLSFPSSLPKLILENGSKHWGVIPHVETDGGLCIVSNAAALKISSPSESVDFSLARAKAILLGDDIEDFSRDFNNYWISKRSDSSWVLSLSKLEDFEANIFWFQYGNNYLISKDSDLIQRWAKNRGYKTSDIFISKDTWVDVGCFKFPIDYPKTIQDLLNLLNIHKPELLPIIHKKILSTNTKQPIFVKLSINNKIIQTAIVYTGLERIVNKSVSNGFRRGAITWDVVARRNPNVTSDVEIDRLGIKLINSEGLSFRSGSGIDLSSKRVAVIGCGSLGGYVAHMLARAGVGKLLLLDYELLSWDNAGRHILGGLYAGHHKSESLKNLLQRDAPHLKIESMNLKLESILTYEPNRLKDYDLVISTTGSWSSDYDLNYWVRKSDINCSILIAWTEPHGVAGHSLFVHSTLGGCLKCGCNDWGEFNQSVVKPDSIKPLKGHGCSGFFQPYGVAEIMPIASMVVKHGIDILMNRCMQSELRSYIAPKFHFDHNEVEATETWAALINSNNHGFYKCQNWHVNPSCACCL